MYAVNLPRSTSCAAGGRSSKVWRHRQFAFRLAAALPREMTDHVCAWAAASPARYRASSSSKAASMLSRSNATAVANRPVCVDFEDDQHLCNELRPSS